MTQTALNYKRLPTQTPAANTVEAWMNSIFTAFSSATYFNGAARTPGSGSAHTVSRFQNAGQTESVYATPPNSGTGSLLHYRWILAGDDAAHTPRMCATPADTWATNTILASIWKGSGTGTFGTWDDATSPFTGTGSTFFGYWRSLTTATTVAKIYCYESQDTAWVVFEDGAGLTYPIHLGPRSIDPDSTETSDGETATDNAMSCLHTLAQTAIPVAWQEAQQAPAASLSNLMHHHTTVNTTAHFGVFQPGSGTVLNCMKAVSRNAQPGTSSSRLRSGRYAAIPIIIQGHAVSPNDRTFGRLREVCFWGSETHGVVHQNGGVDYGHVISRSTGAANPALILLC